MFSKCPISQKAVQLILIFFGISATTQFEDLISNSANSGVKFLWATHNINQAKRFANDIIFISDGKVSEISEAKNFFKKPSSINAQNYIKGL